MAANVDVTFKATLKYTDGTAATSVAVKAIRQQDPLLAATMATADIIEGTSNSSTGVISLTLKGYDLVPVVYKIVLPDGQYFYLDLPKNAKAVNVGILTVSASPAVGVKNITPLIAPFFQGQDIASAAAIAPTCNVHKITGTTSITSISSTATQDYPIGQPLTLIFGASLTFTDGNNLKLAGNFSATADDTITLISDGTDFYEVARSAN
jgi:hypothetical protein